MKNYIFFALGIVGFILFLVLFIKLIIGVWNVPIHLFTWFLSLVNILITIIGVGVGALSFILLLIAICWSAEWLWTRISGYFINLNQKVSELLKNKPEKILPLLIAAVSETFILILSKGFTTGDIKIFFSLILLIILSIILITTSREKKRYWGGIAVIILLGLTTWLTFIKYQINSFSSFINEIQKKWSEIVVSSTTIDLLSVGLIAVSFLFLIALSIFYGFAGQKTIANSNFASVGGSE